MTAARTPADTRKRATRVAKTERLEVRASPEQKALLQYAAELEGRSLSDFVIRSAERAAQQLVRKRRVIKLSAADSVSFVEALLNPQTAGAELRRGADQYKTLMASD